MTIPQDLNSNHRKFNSLIRAFNIPLLYIRRSVDKRKVKLLYFAILKRRLSIMHKTRPIIDLNHENPKINQTD